MIKIPRFTALLLYIVALSIIVITILVIDSNSYVAVSFAGIEPRMKLWAFVVILVTLYFLVRSLVRYSLYFFSGRWLENRREHNRNQRFNEALLAYLEGNWQLVIRLLKPLNKSGYALGGLLIGARTASQINKFKLADNWLEQAFSMSKPSQQLAVQLTRVSVLRQRQQLEEALQLIDELDDQFIEHPGVLQAKFEILQSLQRWDELRQLIKTYESKLRQFVSKATLNKLKQEDKQAEAPKQRLLSK